MDVHTATEIAYKNGYKAGMFAKTPETMIDSDGCCANCGTLIAGFHETGTPIPRAFLKFCHYCGARFKNVKGA